MTRTMCEVCLYPGGPEGALKADNGDIENDKYQALPLSLWGRSHWQSVGPLESQENGADTG